MSTPAPAPVKATPLALAVVLSVLVLALGLLSALVGLYALAPVADRPSLTPIFQSIGAGLPAVGGAVLVFLNSRRQHAETTGNLSVITAQTNGVLTDRIAAGVASALAARDAAAAAAAAAVYVPPQLAPATATPVAAPLAAAVPLAESVPSTP